MEREDTETSVFISYAREDDTLRKQLEKHLSLLKRQNIIKVWHDRDIMGGDDWAASIDAHLKDSRLVLLLISADFLASDYCYSIEMQEALAKDERGEATVIPILLRPVDWNTSPFSHLQALPKNGHPVVTWRSRDEAFVDIVNGIRELLKEQTPKEKPSSWPLHIPDEPYYILPKREQHLNQMLSMLLEQQGHRMLVIDGLGGLGKTSIGVELARRALKSGQFQGIVGESAKQEYLVSGDIITLPEASLDLDRFLNELARQVGHPEIYVLKEDAKLHALADIFRQHSYLILVDNLETFEDIQNLVFHLNRIVGGSRVIITSRQRVEHNFVLSRKLEGLDVEDSLFFLQKEIERTDNQQLRNASEDKLVEIHNITGGAPLALKLIAAQTMFLDASLVLKQLQRAKGQSQLYTFIFLESWKQLSETAQMLLVYIGKTVATTISWQELVDEHFAEEEDLQEATRQLLTYSLLDTSSSNQIHYGIHQLTRQFVTSDLPKLWGLI